MDMAMTSCEVLTFFFLSSCENLCSDLGLSVRVGGSIRRAARWGHHVNIGWVFWSVYL